MSCPDKKPGRGKSAPNPSHREDITMELTRRHALAGAAALAATPLLPTISAHAAAPVADKQAPSFYRYKVGDAQVNVDYGPLVVNTGGKLVVIDTGNGPGAFVNSKGNSGQFATNLVAAGFDPKAIDMVVISHFHGDHVNGLLT